MIDDSLNRLLVKRGANLPQSKLDDQTVMRIRQLNERKKKLVDKLNQKYSASALAKKYRVHRCTIEKILAGETWTHI